MASVQKITTVAAVGSTGRKAVAWASSAAGAREKKKEMCAKHGLKQNGATFEAVEVPTSKAGIIEWLNENVTSE